MYPLLVLVLQLVIAVHQSLATIDRLNEFCRVRQRWSDKERSFVTDPIGFVVFDVFGIVGSVFFDFGDTFEYRNADTFYPATARIAALRNGLPTGVRLADTATVSAVPESVRF